VTAEELVRAAFNCGNLGEQQARELRGFIIEHDKRHPPSAETRADLEAKRLLLEQQSLLITQEAGERDRIRELNSRAFQALKNAREALDKAAEDLGLGPLEDDE